MNQKPRNTVLHVEDVPEVRDRIGTLIGPEFQYFGSECQADFEEALDQILEDTEQQLALVIADGFFSINGSGEDEFLGLECLETAKLLGYDGPSVIFTSDPKYSELVDIPHLVLDKALNNEVLKQTLAALLTKS